MNQYLNAAAVGGLVVLGLAAKFGPANGDQVVLAVVGALAGFITGVAVTKAVQ